MADQPKEWWQQGYGFRVQSGTSIDGKLCGYSVVTDEHCGFTYYKDGDKRDHALRNSVEVCGERSNSEDVAKIIYAKNGDIHIEAPKGQIVLKAANIRLVAEDMEGEVTIQSARIVEVDAPVNRVKGTNVDITSTNSTNILGNYVESAAGVQQSSSSLTDIFQGSFIGQILNTLGNLKKFLKITGL